MLSPYGVRPAGCRKALFTVNLARRRRGFEPRGGLCFGAEAKGGIVSQDDSSQRPRRSAEVAYRSVGDEGGLVVVPAESKVQVLNPVGSKIYSMLDGKNTREDIINAVVEEFEVPGDQARSDLDVFLAELEAHDMLSAPLTLVESERQDP